MSSNNKGKIIVFYEGILPSRFASAKNTILHAQGFLNLGYEVVIYTNIKINNVVDLYDYYGISKKIKFRKISEPNFFVSLLFKYRYKYLIGKLIDYKLGYLKIIRELNMDKNIKFIYLRGGRLVQGLKRERVYKKMIVETHSVRINEYLKSGFFASNIFFSTISKSVVESYSDFGVNKNKFLVFPDVAQRFDSKDFSKVKTSKLRFIYCGTLAKEKGLEILKSLAIELKKYNSAELVIISGNRLEVFLLKIFLILRKCKNTNCFGFVKPSNIYKYLFQADIGLVPLASSKSPIMDFKSTSPLKMFEYLVSGCVVVASKVDGTEDIIRDGINGFLVEFDDKDKFISKCLFLLKNKHLIKKLSLNGLKESLNYSYDKRCKAIVDFLDN